MIAYDYIIAGGGCAGLSLAFHLLQSPLQQKKVLIVDRSPKNSNDRTWSFWAEKPTLFEEIMYKSWQQLEFKSSGFTQTFDLGNWRYNMIRGVDFYEFVIPKLQQNPNIDWVFGEIEAIDSDSEKAWLEVNGEKYTGNWLFDSTFSASTFEKNETKYHYLQQHFKGYVINTNKAIFNPDLPVLFDFNIPQEEEVRFVYILPDSSTKALVEFTIFSNNLLKEEAYDEHLKAYLKDNLGLEKYEVEEVEFGVIPMTDHPLPQRSDAQKRIMNIGTKGGQSKPSSGYTFWRIQVDCEQIVASLQKSGEPFYPSISPKRFRLFDSMLLNIMHRQGGLIRPIFVEMFKNNPIERIFRFLNEESSLSEDLQVMASVPPRPFLKALWRLKVKNEL